MPTQEMIDANNDNDLSDDYFYDEFCYKCKFLKINRRNRYDMNFCKNKENSGDKYCNDKTCPFWHSREM